MNTIYYMYTNTSIIAYNCIMSSKRIVKAELFLIMSSKRIVKAELFLYFVLYKKDIHMAPLPVTKIIQLLQNLQI